MITIKKDINISKQGGDFYSLPNFNKEIIQKFIRHISIVYVIFTETNDNPYLRL